eukprot:TRINITY_DN41684_c0_g1_i1.p1 TRINITY_DN41684_c0_g1~~TRINITY_DN41684_c0_g1_i1.p1  ORF type:complete len:121 (-),score=12.19 TRINITY_DN41684_c0_g1_i1:524-886(-)
MPFVQEWVHATSEENLKKIRRDGRIKGNRCHDRFFDGALISEEAPKGTWFNANNYNGGRITLTVYPEKLKESECPGGQVPGLAFPVADLLGPVEFPTWHLFSVSDKQRGYRQVKYAIVSL